MKNYLLLTASAVLVLSSCSNNEFIENNDLKTTESAKMSIATYVPGLTRANYEAWQAADTSLQRVGFTLVADEAIESSFENLFSTELMYDFGTWKSSDPEIQMQWPEDPNTSVYFYAAFSPSNLADNAIDDDEEVGKVWNMTVSGKEDLMAATSTTSLAETGRDGGTVGQVDLRFEHILAQVEVNFVGTTEGYEYAVGGAKLKAAGYNQYKFENGSFVVNEDVDSITYVLDNVGISADGINYNDTPNFLSEDDDDAYASLMVVPGNCTLSVNYRISMSGQNVEPKVASFNFNAQKGYKTIVTVNLNPETKAMTFSVDVAGWEETEKEFNI